MRTDPYIEIAVEDSERALRFYGNVFNWAYFRAPSETPYYVMGRLNGPSLAGIFPAAFAPQMLPFVKAMAGQFEPTLGRIRKHGGRVIEAHPEEGLGSVAQWKDPDGNKFGLTEPYADAPVAMVTADKVAWRPRINSKASAGIGFVEIGVNNEARALDFYRGVFSWSTMTRARGSMHYHFAGRAGDNAIAAIRPSAQAPQTTPFFSTGELEAVLRRVTKNGGLVFDRGREGNGVMAQCKDPDGNLFGLVEYSNNVRGERIPAAPRAGAGARGAT